MCQMTAVVKMAMAKTLRYPMVWVCTFSVVMECLVCIFHWCSPVSEMTSSSSLFALEILTCGCVSVCLLLSSCWDSGLLGYILWLGVSLVSSSCLWRWLLRTLSGVICLGFGFSSLHPLMNVCPCSFFTMYDSLSFLCWMTVASLSQRPVLWCFTHTSSPFAIVCLAFCFWLFCILPFSGFLRLFVVLLVLALPGWPAVVVLPWVACWFVVFFPWRVGLVRFHLPLECFWSTRELFGSSGLFALY